ncbi:MAG: DinB family protein [Vicinamibacterales bacterium]
MAVVHPYGALLAHHDPIDVLVRTSRELPMQVRAWAPARFETASAPGERTGHRILLHLLHMELAYGLRVRMAFLAPGDAARPVDPDLWEDLDALNNGPVALAAWSALRAANIRIWEDVRRRYWAWPFAHPEFGAITLRELAAIWAGHDLHHLSQLRAIDRVSLARETA